MKLMTKTLAGVLMTVLAAGCGGDDSSDVKTMANTAAASSAVSELAGLREALASTDGNTAALAIFSLGGAASQVIVADGSAYQESAPATRAGGSCECTETGCTFVDCGEANTFLMNGFIDRDGDTVSFDLEMTYGTAGLMWNWAYEGSITITETSINGSLSGTGSGDFEAEGQSGSFSWDWSVDYDAIVLDGSGCATGGSMSADVSSEASSGGQSGNFSGSATVDFGPACGAVSVR